MSAHQLLQKLLLLNRFHCCFTATQQVVLMFNVCKQYIYLVNLFNLYVKWLQMNLLHLNIDWSNVDWSK